VEAIRRYSVSQVAVSTTLPVITIVVEGEGPE
jgi:hypothetical protein